MKNLWESCEGQKHIQPLALTVTRVVESQEQVATLSLVDDLNEQLILESLLENSKPVLPTTPVDYHYLLSTPFRYPPLPYGSRFGSRLYNGIFYASLTDSTALTETAYYRFVFWHGMQTPPPDGRLTTELSTFTVPIKTEHGVRLEQPPFNAHTEVINDPTDYQAPQALGSAMREADVDAFTYTSARDRGQGINLGCFHLSAISAKAPNDLAGWTCVTDASNVSFIKKHAQDTHLQFSIDQFRVDGTLPCPAC